MVDYAMCASFAGCLGYCSSPSLRPTWRAHFPTAKMSLPISGRRACFPPLDCSSNYSYCNPYSTSNCCYSFALIIDASWAGHATWFPTLAAGFSPQASIIWEFYPLLLRRCQIRPIHLFCSDELLNMFREVDVPASLFGYSSCRWTFLVLRLVSFDICIRCSSRKSIQSAFSFSPQQVPISDRH